MLGVLLSLSPVFAFGVVALVVRSRGVQLQIANLTRQSPAGLRSKRSREVDAVVLHQMSFSRGTDPARYHRVKAHFIVLPDCHRPAYVIHASSAHVIHPQLA